jgi:hypothetical protein
MSIVLSAAIIDRDTLGEPTDVVCQHRTRDYRLITVNARTLMDTRVSMEGVISQDCYTIKEPASKLILLGGTCLAAATHGTLEVFSVGDAIVPSGTLCCVV